MYTDSKLFTTKICGRKVYNLRFFDNYRGDIIKLIRWNLQNNWVKFAGDP